MFCETLNYTTNGFYAELGCHLSASLFGPHNVAEKQSASEYPGAD